MALIPCFECGQEISTAAEVCPKCGAVARPQPTAPSTPAVPTGKVTQTQYRKVSVALIIGIVLMPYIFAWFLLRKGYSGRAQFVGLGWMALVLLVAIANRSNPGGVVDGGSASSKFDIDPNSAEKDEAAYLAKQIVPSAMKDPSSAEFGQVWGVTANVACGFVNGKNSFGAMTGKQGFIMKNGQVWFESGRADFARRWNATCLDKPRGPAPTGAGGIRWGSHPPSSLKQYAPATSEGLAVFTPKSKPEPLEGVSVNEADYEFDRGRLFSANFYIDGNAGRDAIIAAYVKKYGTPQAYNEGKGSYEWKWRGKKISLHINYDAAHGRTTVNFNHE